MSSGAALRKIAEMSMFAQSDPHAPVTTHRKALIDICNLALAELEASAPDPPKDCRCDKSVGYVCDLHAGAALEALTARVPHPERAEPPAMDKSELADVIWAINQACASSPDARARRDGLKAKVKVLFEAQESRPAPPLDYCAIVRKVRNSAFTRASSVQISASPSLTSEEQEIYAAGFVDACNDAIEDILKALRPAPAALPEK